MSGPVRASITRLAVLCALVFGVLAMHHVTTGTIGPTAPAESAHHSSEHTGPTGDASGDAPAPSPGGHHGGFHMCLAVLLAATVLTITAWLLVRTARARPMRARRAAGPAAHAGRAPPFAPTTSVFLSSLCILRV